MVNPYSALKIFHHVDALDSIRKGETIPPFYIRIKPTNICNHHCSYCTYGSGSTHEKTENRDEIDHRDKIPWEKMQEILNDFVDIGVKAITFSGGGEPLTYSNIVDAARICEDGGIDLSLITNGQLLKGEKAHAFKRAKWVRVSFDSPIPSEYAELRGLNECAFYEVTKNVENFVKIKKDSTVLGINFVISKSNYTHVYEAAKLLKELGVDNVKFAAVIDNNKGYHDLIKDSVIEQIHRAIDDFSNNGFQIINNYEWDNQDRQFHNVNMNECFTCRLVSVVGADQKVYLCHTRAYDSRAVVADLRNQSFKKAWFSDKTQSFLRELNPSKVCKNICAYEERNILIQKYYESDGDHVNFI